MKGINNPYQRKVPVPPGARINPYYDTQPVKQNEETINFFPANTSRQIYRNNYISNPFPGNAARRVAGLSFEPTAQFIREDTNIDVEAIVNALKFAGVVITADQSHEQFLRAPIGEYSNFHQTEIESVKSKAYVNGAFVDKTKKIAVLKSAAMYRVDDPFDIAANQNVTVKVVFDDASDFPTEAQWNNSTGNVRLRLHATLYLAEVEKEVA